MKIKEIKEKSSDELVIQQARPCARKTSTCALQQVRRATWKRPSRLRDIRREVARIETVLSERKNKQAVAGVKA